MSILIYKNVDCILRHSYFADKRLNGSNKDQVDCALEFKGSSLHPRSPLPYHLAGISYNYIF